MKNRAKALARLPLWARSEIEKLTADVASRDKQLATLTGEGPSPVYTGLFRGWEYQMPVLWLPTETVVNFELGNDRNGRSVGLSARLGHRVLSTGGTVPAVEIHANGSSVSLGVGPESHNTATLFIPELRR